MQPPLTESAGLQLQRELERCIAQRTHGRVHGLRVEVRENRVLVSGRTSSDYLRQLVTVAVLEHIESGAVEFDVEVEPRL